MTPDQLFEANKEEIRFFLTRTSRYASVSSFYKVEKTVVLDWAAKLGVERPKPKPKTRPRAEDRKELDQLVSAGVDGDVIRERLRLDWSTFKKWTAANRQDSLAALDLTSKAFPRPMNGCGVSLLAIRPGQCRRPLWPLSEVTGRFCALPVQEGSAYCPGCREQLVDLVTEKTSMPAGKAMRSWVSNTNLRLVRAPR